MFRPIPARHVSEPLARVIGHLLAQQTTPKDQEHAERFLESLRAVRDQKKESSHDR